MLESCSPKRRNPIQVHGDLDGEKVYPSFAIDAEVADVHIDLGA